MTQFLFSSAHLHKHLPFFSTAHPSPKSPRPFELPISPAKPRVVRLHPKPALQASDPKMPIYVTCKVFACGHAGYRRDGSVGVGSDAARLITETLTLNTKCGLCLAGKPQNLPLPGGRPCIPRYLPSKKTWV